MQPSVKNNCLTEVEIAYCKKKKSTLEYPYMFSDTSSIFNNAADFRLRGHMQR